MAATGPRILHYSGVPPCCGSRSTPGGTVDCVVSQQTLRAPSKKIVLQFEPLKTMLRLQDVTTVTFGDFEWDAEKAADNAAKHGVTFEEATTVFLDLEYLLIRDATEAERFVAMGMSRQARILFVVHCERGEKIRIVSARRATRRERETYERRRDTD